MDKGNVKPSWSEKLGYGMGGFTLAMTISLGNYLTVYLTNTAFLDIAVVSTILATSRIFDGISDVLVGNLIDNTRTIHGKARVWIRRTSIPLAVSAFLMYYVPKTWPDGVRYVYVFLMYNLFTAAFATLFIVPHNALLPLITADTGEHRRLSSIAGFFQKVAFMVASAVFVKLLMVFTDEPGNPMTQKAFSCVITIIGCLMAASCLAEYYLTKERTEPEKDTPKPGFLTDLKLLFTNKYWVIMLFSTVSVYAALSCFDGAMSYYTLYVMGDFEAMALFTFVIGISGIATSVVLILVSYKIGAKKLFIASQIMYSAGIAGIYFAGTGRRALLIVALAVIGAGNGSAVVATQALVTEILIYSYKTGGKLIVGLGNAGMNAARKLGLGLSMAVFGYVMAAAGFDAKLDAQGIAQPEGVIRAINTGFVWFPIAVSILITLVFLLFFDMEKKMKDIAVKDDDTL